MSSEQKMTVLGLNFKIKHWKGMRLILSSNPSNNIIFSEVFPYILLLRRKERAGPGVCFIWLSKLTDPTLSTPKKGPEMHPSSHGEIRWAWPTVEGVTRINQIRYDTKLLSVLSHQTLKSRKTRRSQQKGWKRKYICSECNSSSQQTLTGKPQCPCSVQFLPALGNTKHVPHNETQSALQQSALWTLFKAEDTALDMHLF